MDIKKIAQSISVLFVFAMLWAVVFSSSAWGATPADRGDRGFGIFEIEPPDASLVAVFPSDITLIKSPNITGAGLLRWTDRSFNGSITNIVTPPTPFSESHTDERYLPTLYFSIPLSEKLYAGFAVGRAFGLDGISDPPDDSLFRYQRTLSDFITYNLTPVIAYAFNQYVSVGFGVDFYHRRRQSNGNIVNFALPILNPIIDIQAFSNQSASAIGYHTSLSLNVPKYKTHVVVAYRGGVFLRYEGLGTGIFPFFPPPVEKPSVITSQTHIPAKFRLNISQPVTNRLILLAGYSYTWIAFGNQSTTFTNAPVFGSITISGRPRNVPSVNGGLVYRLFPRMNVGTIYRWERSASSAPRADDIHHLILLGSYFTKVWKVSVIYDHTFQNTRSLTQLLPPIPPNVSITGAETTSEDEVILKLSFNL